jgi:hypothetical protein
MSPPRTAARKATFVSSPPREGTDDRRKPFKTGKPPLPQHPPLLALINPHELSMSISKLLTSRTAQPPLSMSISKLPASPRAAQPPSAVDIDIVYESLTSPGAHQPPCAIAVGIIGSMWFVFVTKPTRVKRKHKRGLTMGLVLWWRCSRRWR